MKTPKEIIREMRTDCAMWPARVQEWADDLEAAMLEPVAVYDRHSMGGSYAKVILLTPAPMQDDTKLYALPPDAAAEIKREVEHSALLVKEIERLKAVVNESFTTERVTAPPDAKDEKIKRLRALLAEGRDIIACIATAEQAWLGQANAALAATDPAP
jgi:hypothetical protein